MTEPGIYWTISKVLTFFFIFSLYVELFTIFFFSFFYSFFCEETTFVSDSLSNNFGFLESKLLAVCMDSLCV